MKGYVEMRYKPERALTLIQVKKSVPDIIQRPPVPVPSKNSLDWINKNFKYEQDHLHPYDRFDGSKPVSVTMDAWRRWRGNRNRLPNLQLLEGRSNGSKNDMPLIEYYNDMNDDQKAEFRKQAFIPDGIGLELEHFEEFYEKRKALLTSKIRQLLG